MATSHAVVQVDFSKREAAKRNVEKSHLAMASSRPMKGELSSTWWESWKSDSRLIEPLTDRELRFLDCLARGVSNKEIARSLCVSENTVKFHLKNVYSKFAVKTRLQAIKVAYELGLLAQPDSQNPSVTGALS